MDKSQADLTHDVWHKGENDMPTRRDENSRRLSDNNIDDNDPTFILKSIDKHLVENQHLLKEINHQLINNVSATCIGDDISIERRFFRNMSEKDFIFDLEYLQALRRGYTQNN